MAIIRVTAAQLKTGAEELRNLNQQFKAAVSDLESTEGSQSKAARRASQTRRSPQRVPSGFYQRQDPDGQLLQRH